MTEVGGSELSETILVVDDDEVFRGRLARALERRGLAVRVAADGAEAVALAGAESPELAVVDLRMPGPSGLEVVKELRAIDASTRILVLTGYGSIATAIEAIRLGAVHYLQKPADADEILRALREPEAAAEERAANELGQEPTSPDAVPSLARVEWEHIHRVLADCGGNVSQAARLLGIHRRSLQRKLGKLPTRR
ncbi:MAG: response regulator [Myxococcales bacterium]|nr:response regulator [Myxococcales bacterium]MCB9732545.1 response regulator [Deltaproteobacteria bacterium]